MPLSQVATWLAYLPSQDDNWDYENFIEPKTRKYMQTKQLSSKIFFTIAIDDWWTLKSIRLLKLLREHREISYALKCFTKLKIGLYLIV